MSDFLIETLVWTGALIALVLVLRRPVARQFGAGAAYALWFLPAARLVMPPLLLPAWLAPDAEPASYSVEPLAMASSAGALPLAGSELGEIAPVEPAVSFDVAAVLLALWLLGAAIFLVRRFALYHRMRAELLDGARPVGEVGTVRLVETDAVDGPLAFGVIDRVVALPTGLINSRDRRARDLVIAHELAHHRGRDLLVNMLVQPLFALHWFNPLGWMGWTAMRRDQEAACDARVVARSDAEERATYAAVIASFATRAGTGGRPALAAPMACPVLGDKSIIHRLRSLTMTEISPRRRMASRALLVGGALALPLTASITYAETIGQEIEVPTPPAPPTPPTAPGVPLPPTPPQPGEFDDETREEIAEMEQELDEMQDEVAELEREIVKDGQRQVIRIRRSGKPGAEQQRVRRIIRFGDLEIEPADRAKLEKALEKFRTEGSAMNVDAERIRAQVESAMSSKTGFELECPEGLREALAKTVDGNGRELTVLCRSNAFSAARSSILQARSAIARDPQLSEKSRTEALRSMDEALAEVEASRKEAGGA